MRRSLCNMLDVMFLAGIISAVVLLFRSRKLNDPNKTDIKMPSFHNTITIGHRP